MTLTVLQGPLTNDCLHMGRQLQQAGFMHLDLTHWLSARKDPAQIVRLKEARVRCHAIAMQQVLKGKSVVISTDYFRPADRLRFEAVGCPVEILTVDKSSKGFVLARVQKLACQAQPKSLFQRLKCAKILSLTSLLRSWAWN